jgi:hypothetical protein
MRKRGTAWACRRVVGDAERILAGCWVDRYRQYGLSPPAWAVVNDLAHTTLAGLTRRATAPILWPRSHQWERAERDLAAVLLATADAKEILRLQQEVLVPLELTLLDNPSVCSGEPAALVDLVTEALGRDCRGS